MKNVILALARITLIGVFMLHTVSSVSAKGGTGGAYQTGFVRWRAADGGFGGWALNGVKLNAGALEFDPGTASAGSDPYLAGSYNGGNYYNGGSFFVGEATSPEITTAFNYKEAIASWNASTPAGSWVEVQFRAQYGTRWSKWYVLGIWASDTLDNPASFRAIARRFGRVRGCRYICVVGKESYNEQIPAQAAAVQRKWNFDAECAKCICCLFHLGPQIRKRFFGQLE